MQSYQNRSYKTTLEMTKPPPKRGLVSSHPKTAKSSITTTHVPIMKPLSVVHVPPRYESAKSTWFVATLQLATQTFLQAAREPRRGRLRQRDYRRHLGQFGILRPSTHVRADKNLRRQPGGLAKKLRAAAAARQKGGFSLNLGRLRPWRWFYFQSYLALRKKTTQLRTFSGKLELFAIRFVTNVAKPRTGVFRQRGSRLQLPVTR